MSDQATKVAVLGSTGSIGRNALEVIAASGGRLEAVALAAHRNTELLEDQAARFGPRWVVVTDPQAAAEHAWSRLGRAELLAGSEAVEQIVASPEVDIVLSAIVGSAGLQGTWAASRPAKPWHWPTRKRSSWPARWSWTWRAARSPHSAGR